MSARHTYFDQETRTRIIDYSMEVEGLGTPDEVLNRLHDIISEKNPIRSKAPTDFRSRSVTGAALSLVRTSSSIGMFLGAGWRNGPHLWQVVTPWGS